MQAPPRRTPLCRHLLLPFYLLASLALTWPLARDFGSHLPAISIPYDALLQVFLLGWGWHGLTTHPLAVFDAPIFYPEVRTLAYMDHMLGEAVLAGPVIEAFGLAAAYNTLVIFSFVASAYFLYRLARLYGVSRSGSCVAGFLFAFCPYRFSHLGCLNQIQTQFIPLGIFLAARFLRSGRTRYGVAAGFTLAVQSYFGWYATFHLLVALCVLLGWDALRRPGGWRSVPWTKVAVSALVAAFLVVPSALPYLFQKWAMPEFGHPFSETIRLSADLRDYLRVNPDNVLARFIPPLGGRWAGFCPGLVASVLGAVAILSMRRVRERPHASDPQGGRESTFERVRTTFRRWENTGYFLALGTSGLVLSLGPFLQVGGLRLWIPLPYALCYFLIPGFASMRTPGRFAVLVALATAALAGFGFDALRRRYPRLGFSYPRLNAAFLAGVLLGAGALAWSPGMPFVPCPDRASMPPVYGWLAAQPGTDPILELPVSGRRNEGPVDLQRQMYLLYHGKPRLDGASGFISNRYAAFRRDMQAFPAPEAIALAYNMGARRLIVHYADYTPARREAIRHQVDDAADLREVAAFGEDVVYEIRGAGAPSSDLPAHRR